MTTCACGQTFTGFIPILTVFRGIIKPKTRQNGNDVHTWGNERMNVNVIDQTILGIDTDHVERITMDTLTAVNVDDVSINIVMTCAIAPCNGQRHMRTVGTCDHVPPYPNRYVIHVVNDDNWRFTLHHELYHVYEFVNGIPSNEFACDHFASIMMNVCR